MHLYNGEARRISSEARRICQHIYFKANIPDGTQFHPTFQAVDRK